MPTPITICDDSSFARKQMAQALPAGWDVALHYAENGAQALVAVESGQAHVLFLDLNMPVMDGYEALAHIRARDLPTMIIVVSGDIQPEARARVMQLGAMAFLKKPVQPQELAAVLAQYGIRPEPGAAPAAAPAHPPAVAPADGYREIANVAMGRAADFLARLLNVFVTLPVPTVARIDHADLRMMLGALGAEAPVSAVCQGFIGAGIAGEALLIFHESSYADIAALMHHVGEIDDKAEIELLMDLANVLVGAFLKGIADQLDVGFSMSHPVVLGRHVHTTDLLRSEATRWREALAIELGYRVEGRPIRCDLLLLLTDDSIAALDTRLQYILG